MDQYNSCTYIAAAILFFAILYFIYQNYYFESFQTYFTSPDPFLPNSNAFGNYYRTGYEQSKDLGWKPSDNWDHLRPEFSICPDKFRTNPVYFDDYLFEQE